MLQDRIRIWQRSNKYLSHVLWQQVPVIAALIIVTETLMSGRQHSRLEGLATFVIDIQYMKTA